MRCQQCRQHRSAGAHYRFYYGHRFPAQAIRYPPADRRFIYSLDGHRDVWICHTCLATRLIFSPLGATVLLGLAAVALSLLAWLRPALAVQLTGPYDPALLVLAAVTVSLLLLLTHVITYGEEWLRVYGDELAITACCHELHQAGYTLFASRWQRRRRRWGGWQE